MNFKIKFKFMKKEIKIYASKYKLRIKLQKNKVL